MIRSSILIAVVASLAACKARKSDSDEKSLIASGDGTMEIIYQPLDVQRLDDSTVAVDSSADLISRPVNGAPDNTSHPVPNFVPQDFVCFATCLSQPTTDSKGVPSNVDCSYSGHAEVSEYITTAGKLSEKAQEYAMQALSQTGVFVSQDDAAFKELKSAVASITKSDQKGEAYCKGRRDGGFSLTGELFLSPICFRNKTGATVRIDATVTYKARGYRYLEEKTAYWTYPPGRESCLDVNGCEDNEDGLCKLGAIKYVASAGGRKFQNNGPGVEFRSSRNTTDEYWINLSGASSSSSSSNGSSSRSNNSSSNNSSNNSSSNNSNDNCLNALKEVYNNYPNSSFQSARFTEVANCLQATVNTDWNNWRSHYYCQYPGQPVRQCFTYGAAALKQKGYSQEWAYKAMFSSCKSNGSFNSFTGQMLSNFEITMTDNPNCGESSINAYYKWLGINRPVR